MDFDEFDEFMEELYAKCKKVRAAKGMEYARDPNDRFANFRRIGNDLKMSPLQVGYIFLRKHLDAIASYIENGGRIYSDERIQGRFIDLITYAFLLAGMAEEMEQKSDGRILRQRA